MSPQALAAACNLSFCVPEAGLDLAEHQMPTNMQAVSLSPDAWGRGVPKTASLVHSAILEAMHIGRMGPGSKQDGLASSPGGWGMKVLQVASAQGPWGQQALPAGGPSELAVAAAVLRSAVSAACLSESSPASSGVLRFLASTLWEQGSDLAAELPDGLGQYIGSPSIVKSPDKQRGRLPEMITLSHRLLCPFP